MKKEFQRENPNKFGLIGRNISYSFSKVYFEEKFEKSKIHATYENFDIPNISDFIKIKKIRNLSGLNVTIPYKEKIIPFLNGLDSHAENIGAVNVIKIKDNGDFIGYNTDFIGFKEAIKPLLLPNHKKALILGTGGASKAVAYAFQQLNIPYKFVSRNDNKDFLNFGKIDSEILKQFQIIVNATPVGTFPEVKKYPPIPVQYLTPNHLIFDLIYNPETTALMLAAKEKGATAINGLHMLQIQAEEAWKIWNSN